MAAFHNTIWSNLSDVFSFSASPPPSILIRVDPTEDRLMYYYGLMYWINYWVLHIQKGDLQILGHGQYLGWYCLGESWRKYLWYQQTHNIFSILCIRPPEDPPIDHHTETLILCEGVVNIYITLYTTTISSLLEDTQRIAAPLAIKSGLAKIQLQPSVICCGCWNYYYYWWFLRIKFSPKLLIKS